MNCTNCGTVNAKDAKFCEDCGTKLINTASSQIGISTSQEEVAITRVVPLSQTTFQAKGSSQQYIEKGKTISKSYFKYFLTALKKPVLFAEKTGSNELINGIITMVLFVLFLPLMTYFGLKGALGDSLFAPDISFASVVIKPFFLLFVIMALVGVIIFATVKLGKSSASLLDVLARLGAFLVVPTALFAVAFILSLLGTVIFIPFLVLGLIGFSFIIPLIVYSYKSGEQRGLDAFYCTLLTYVGIIILFVMLGEQAFQQIESMIDGFNPFGF